MTPFTGLIFQRILCKDRGDCMTACIASLLNLPYDSVPTWVADAHDDFTKPEDPNAPPGPLGHYGAQHRMTVWLRERGLHLLEISWDNLRDWRPLVGAHCIASMPSQMAPGISHAVIGTWEARSPSHHTFKIIHDPNPNNAPYPNSVEPRAVSFLVPLDPANYTPQNPRY
jgi:hypothetical protein